ncbi:MAG: hypothetical protein ABI425_01105 [Patescibacteria group bacterium]
MASGKGLERASGQMLPRNMTFSESGNCIVYRGDPEEPNSYQLEVPPGVQIDSMGRVSRVSRVRNGEGETDSKQ